MISISIGDDCAVANIIKNTCTSNIGYKPFDWCISKNLSSIIEILEDDFIQFTNWNNWYYDTDKIYDKYIKIGNSYSNNSNIGDIGNIGDNGDNSDKGDNDSNNSNIIKTHMLIYSKFENIIKYPHDIRIENAKNDFEEFKVKIARRISRLRNIPANNRIFYRYESNSIKNITIENIEKILKHCAMFKIWLNPKEYNRLIYSKDNRIQYLQKYRDSGKFHIMIDTKWNTHNNWAKKIELF